tara:strand:+ start:55 stop:612 length:558 start_codon:yes stop_codon:yes gene_type:complete
MAYDIVTIEPTVNATAYTAGDVFFGMTAFNLPARSCKLINAFLEVHATGVADEESLSVMFFQDNTGGPLSGATGGINSDADITESNFILNKYVGTISMVSDAAQQVVDIVNTVGFYHGASVISTKDSANSNIHDIRMILKAGADKDPSDTPSTNRHIMYVSGLVNSGTPNLAASPTVKLHLHLEY